MKLVAKENLDKSSPSFLFLFLFFFEVNDFIIALLYCIIVLI